MYLSTIANNRPHHHQASFTVQWTRCQNWTKTPGISFNICMSPRQFMQLFTTNNKVINGKQQFQTPPVLLTRPPFVDIFNATTQPTEDRTLICFKLLICQQAQCTSTSTTILPFKLLTMSRQ